MPLVWMEPHKATPPTPAFDWQPGGEGEPASLKAAFNRHTGSVTFLFFIWMEWNIYINEASQYMYSTKKFFFSNLAVKKKNLDFILFLYILWDMFRDPNRSQKWGLAPRQKIPTYVHPPSSPKTKKTTVRSSRSKSSPPPTHLSSALLFLKGTSCLFKLWVSFLWLCPSPLTFITLMGRKQDDRVIHEHAGPGCDVNRRLFFNLGVLANLTELVTRKTVYILYDL